MGVAELIGPMDLFGERHLSHLVYSAGERVAEFESGPTDFPDEVAGWLNTEFDAEYDFQGGVLRLATSRQHGLEQQLAGWVGQKRSLKTTMAHISRAGFLEVFDHIRIIETADGLILESPISSPLRFPLRGHPPSITQYLNGVGFLSVYPLTKLSVTRLPEWSGTRVPGGELFVDPDDHGGVSSILLVSDSAMARLPLDEESDPPAAASAMSELKATWNLA